MQATGVWLPLLFLCSLLLLPTSRGQNCSEDWVNQNCNCKLVRDLRKCNTIPFECVFNSSIINATIFEAENCPHSVGTIVGISLGVVMLLTGVIVGIVLVIRRKQQWHTPEPGPWKPSESSGSSASAWQPRYSSRNSEQFAVATSPGLSVTPSPSSPAALLYENVFLGSQPSTQSPDPSQTSRGPSQDTEDLYMNYEDSSGADHPIYGNVDNMTSLPDGQAPPKTEGDDEDDYVMPGC